MQTKKIERIYKCPKKRGDKTTQDKNINLIDLGEETKKQLNKILNDLFN